MRNEVGGFLLIDEVSFIFARSFPFRRPSCRQQGVHVVEPKLRDAIEIRMAAIVVNFDAVTLHQPANPWNTRPRSARGCSPSSERTPRRSIPLF